MQRLEIDLAGKSIVYRSDDSVADDWRQSRGYRQQYRGYGGDEDERDEQGTTGAAHVPGLS